LGRKKNSLEKSFVGKYVLYKALLLLILRLLRILVLLDFFLNFADFQKLMALNLWFWEHLTVTSRRMTLPSTVYLWLNVIGSIQLIFDIFDWTENLENYSKLQGKMCLNDLNTVQWCSQEDLSPLKKLLNHRESINQNCLRGSGPPGIASPTEVLILLNNLSSTTSLWIVHHILVFSRFSPIQIETKN
jgi:hypothetical protein